MSKEIRITADDEKKTVTIRYREVTYWRHGAWRQVTFTARDFDKAITEAKIAVPWSAVIR